MATSMASAFGENLPTNFGAKINAETPSTFTAKLAQLFPVAEARRDNPSAVAEYPITHAMVSKIGLTLPVEVKSAAQNFGRIARATQIKPNRIVVQGSQRFFIEVGSNPAM